MRMSEFNIDLETDREDVSAYGGSRYFILNLRRVETVKYNIILRCQYSAGIKPVGGAAVYSGEALLQIFDFLVLLLKLRSKMFLLLTKPPFSSRI